VVAACFVINLPDLGDAKKIKALGVPVRTLMPFLGTLRRAAAGFRFSGGFWRRAGLDRIRPSAVAAEGHRRGWVTARKLGKRPPEFGEPALDI
jgi:hypothetical protein